MTDKIKVWKCDSCKINKDVKTERVCVANNRFPCVHANWQPTTQYRITERKPTTIMDESTNIGIIDSNSPHIKGNPGNTTPPADHTTPPRKRVKIIWSEVNADNVDLAAALNHIKHDRVFEYEKEIIGEIGGIPLLVCDIPKSWLEDIPAEPTGPLEITDLVKKFLDDAGYGHPQDAQMFRIGDRPCDLFMTLVEVAGLSALNEIKRFELRHAPRQTFNDTVKKEPYPNLDKLHLDFMGENGNRTFQNAIEFGWRARGRAT